MFFVKIFLCSCNNLIFQLHDVADSNISVISERTSLFFTPCRVFKPAYCFQEAYF